MKYSLQEFLNEGLGALAPFKDIPKEWKEEILRPGTQNIGGENSEVKQLKTAADFKDITKLLKDWNFLAIIIKVDGKSEYLFQQDHNAPSKLKVRRASGEHSVRYPKKKTNEALMVERRGHHYYNPAEMGNMSIPELQKFIETLTSEGKTVEVFLIAKDKTRQEKRTARYKGRTDIIDPLLPNEAGHDTPSKSQKKRYDIYAEKKRAELDKQVDEEIEKFREQLMNNFDTAMEKILEDMRKGYSWNVEAKAIGEQLMKGIDLSGIKRFAAGYDAIEPNSFRGSNSAEATRKLKKLGFIKESFETFDEEQKSWYSELSNYLTTDYDLLDSDVMILFNAFGPEIEEYRQEGMDPVNAAIVISSDQVMMEEIIASRESEYNEKYPDEFEDVNESFDSTYTYDDYLFDIANALIYQHEQNALQLLEVDEFGPDVEETKVELVNKIDELMGKSIRMYFQHQLDVETATDFIADYYRYNNIGKEKYDQQSA